MKKILVGAIGAVALSMSTPASAADMAARPYTKAPPMVAPIYDWTGFYIGANGGWGQSHGCVDFVTPAGTVAAYAYDEGRLIGACARTQREL
jgi:outer membrane immunogenic protein